MIMANPKKWVIRVISLTSSMGFSSLVGRFNHNNVGVGIFPGRVSDEFGLDVDLSGVCGDFAHATLGLVQ
jgi:hypothetical protein